MQSLIKNIKKNPDRIKNLTIFIFLNFLLSSSFYILSTIYSPLQIAYKINISENFLGLSLVMFGSFLITILNSFYLKKIGLQKAMRIFVTLAMIGCVLRCFLDFSIHFLFFGQFVCGLSNSFFFNSQIAFANLFPKNFHKSFFDVLFFFGYSALGVMGLVPFLYVDEDLKDERVLKNQIWNYFFSLAVFAVFLFFLTFIFFKNENIIDEYSKNKINQNNKKNSKNKKNETKIINSKKEMIKPEKSNFNFSTYKKDLIKIKNNKKYIIYFVILILQRANFSLIISSINYTFSKNNYKEVK